MSDDFLPRTIEQLHLDFPPEITHLSASSISMLLRCEEQYRNRYILGKIKPPSLSMLAGRADHRAIEVSMAQKIESHEDLPIGDVKEMFLETLEAAVDEQGGVTELADPAEAAASYDGLRRDGQTVVGLYHKLISPSVQPVAVEKEFNIEVPGVPVVLNGYIDLVEQNQIIDRKRTNRATKSPKVDWVLQGGIYQLAEPLPYRWHISVTTKVPQFLTEIEQPLGPRMLVERQLRDAALKLGFLWQKYGPDEAWPATGRQHDWACNYCGFKDNDCWAWA